jgi:hypothetical protein
VAQTPPSTWKTWFANAFAVEKPGDIDPTPAQREIIDKLCREVVRRGLAGPAAMALEMSRPLNMLGASALHMLQPIIATMFDAEAAREFAVFLQHRGSIDFLCARIEHLTREADGQTKRPRDEETK